MQEKTYRELQKVLDSPVTFSVVTMPTHKARAYQRPMMTAVWQSVIDRAGKSFAVAFSRQAGKDESIAQLVLALLNRYRLRGGTVVIAAPTDEQAAITLGRLWERAAANPITTSVATRSGSAVIVGKARAIILSAHQEANVRGHTADLMLIANEAQDIDPGIWDSRFAPMGASTNATTLFSGTVWDKSGLLAREMEYLASIETAADRRLFVVPWRDVAAENPAYGNYVEARIAQLGASHPYIQTEYELKPLDAGSRLFSDSLLGQLQGSHERITRRADGQQYAILIDVAGEEEADPGPESFDTSSKRDSTAATVIQLVFEDRASSPTYRIVDRRLWTGVKHTTLHQVLHDLIVTTWGATFVVIDATGIGAGLHSMLSASLSRRRITTIPVQWTSSNKSKAAWDLIAMIATGRLKDYSDDSDDELTNEFHRQMRHVEYQTMTGPGHRIKWGVPVKNGHDDMVMSLALLPFLDEADLRPRTARGM